MKKKRFSFAAIICVEILLGVWLAAAQNVEATIKISADLPNVRAGQRQTFETNGNKMVFFLKSVANADNLGARVTDFQLLDRQNHPVAVKKTA